MHLFSRLFPIIIFGGLMALCAQMTVPMAPVPMTLQTFAVLLAGAALGPLRGVVAVLLYLAVGAAGLPVFSDGGGGVDAFMGPTAGYLSAFPLAAGLVGAVSERPAWRRPLPATALMVLAHLLILGLGAAWLATLIGPSDAVAAGFTPFLIGAVVKSVAVVAAAAGLRRLGLR